jgi:tetratricopeptide (TPR) repeat protein
MKSADGNSGKTRKKGKVISILKGKKSPGPAADISSMEGMLGGMFGPEKNNALALAQDIAWTAWDEPNRKKRIQLAKKAMKVSPDCADAYVILAQESARTPAETEEMYRKGIEAGERAIGKKGFKEGAGHFWGILETRPYMRAKHGLAMTLWDLGKREEAVDHYREMLGLNPNDNQGMREVLLPCLIELGRDVEALRLLKEYEKCASATWEYSAVLLAFRREGDSANSRGLLAEAMKYNKHVPKYLLGREKIGRGLPEFMSLGDENEALVYLHFNTNCWKVTPGAIAWLAQCAK